MKLICNRSTVINIGLLLLVVASLGFMTYQVSAQNDVVSDIMAHLVQNSVPIKSISIKSQIPLQLEAVIQSKSQNEIAAPEDPIFQQAVHREVMEARRRGAKIDSVKVIIINSLNQEIYWSDLPVDKAVDTIPVFPSPLEDVLLTSEIHNRVPLNGMTFDAVNTTRNADGSQIIFIKLSVKDIETANDAVSNFMLDLSRTINEIRSQKKAQIATYTVELADATGQPLLKYVKDYMPSEARESWWQAPGMTQDWFPHPLPPSDP